jgi:hypothetical protein
MHFHLCGYLQLMPAAATSKLWLAIAVNVSLVLPQHALPLVRLLKANACRSNLNTLACDGGGYVSCLAPTCASTWAATNSEWVPQQPQHFGLRWRWICLLSCPNMHFHLCGYLQLMPAAATSTLWLAIAVNVSLVLPQHALPLVRLLPAKACRSNLNTLA